MESELAQSVDSGLVDLADGRKIGWTAWGDAGGVPVLYEPHAGSSGERALEDDVAPYRDAGIRLIAIARPGLGRSTQHRGRTVKTDADDLLAVADALTVDSGIFMAACTGAGATLALAAASPDRVRGLVLSAPFAPLRAAGSNTYVDRNLNALRRSFRWRWVAKLNANAVARSFQRDPDAFLDRAWSVMPEADREILNDPARRELTKAEYAQLMADPNVYVDEWRPNTGKWNRLDWRRITARVVIFHGAKDTTAPVGMGKWLCAHVLDCDLRIEPERGHYLPPSQPIAVLQEMAAATPTADTS